MRRKEKSLTSIVVIIIVVIVGIILLFKMLGNNKNKDYTNYVGEYMNALEKYIQNDLDFNVENTYMFNEINDNLIRKGYINKYKNENIIITADDITIKKSNGIISFYNYVNTKTLENRFELKFNDGEKQYICTKIECR